MNDNLLIYGAGEWNRTTELRFTNSNEEPVVVENPPFSLADDGKLAQPARKPATSRNQDLEGTEESLHEASADTSPWEPVDMPSTPFSFSPS